MKYCFPVYEFRPLPTERKLLRYNGGKWTADDGEYDICFITDDRNGAPMCYYFSLPYRKNLLWSWAKNGQWGSYVGRHPDGNAWHYMSKDGYKNIDADWDRESHPNEIVSEEGMAKVSSKCGVSNGSGPELQIGDEYILAGLVREKSTKRPIKFPKVFKCVYCGDHDVFKEDSRLSKSNHPQQQNT